MEPRGFGEPDEYSVASQEPSQLISSCALHWSLSLRSISLDVIPSDKALDPLYKSQAYSYRLRESDIVIMGTKELAKKYRRGFPGSLDKAPFLLPMDSSVQPRALEQWFNDLNIAPDIRAEFADSAMMKIAARQGFGLFATPLSIQKDVTAIYGLQKVGLAEGAKERLYSVSVERRLKHPAVVAARENAAGFARLGKQ